MDTIEIHTIWISIEGYLRLSMHHPLPAPDITCMRFFDDLYPIGHYINQGAHYIVIGFVGGMHGVGGDQI